MTTADGPSSAPSRRRRRGAAAVIVGLGALLPALVTALGGGFGIARNDDYAYLATVRVFVEHGTFQLRGLAFMTLVGQVVLASPVAWLTGSNTTALQLTTLAVGTVGLVAVTALARRVLDLKRAVIVGVAITATPLWVPLATSFMTDVWAFGLAAVAVALAVWAVEAASGAGFVVRLLGAFVAASAAFFVRQTLAGALVAVVVGVLVGLVRVRAERPNRTTERIVALGLAAVSGVGCLVGYRWRSTMPLESVPSVPWDLSRFARPFIGADRALVTLALLLLPVSVAFIRREQVVRRARSRPRFSLVTGVGIAWLVVLKLAGRSVDDLTLSDYVTRYGPASESAPAAPVAMVPTALWIAIVAVAAANLWVLLVVLSGPGLRRCWQQRPVVFAVTATMVVAPAAAATVAWIVSFQMFDRYLLPIAPFGGLLVAWVSVVDRAEGAGVEERARAVPPLVLGPRRVAALVGLVALASWFGLASASFDRAVHRAGDRAVEVTGVDASGIDVGMTVNGARAAEGPWREPVLSSTSPRCWRVLQTDDRAKATGPVVGHDQLLWVDRWFYLVPGEGVCPGSEQPGG